MKDDYEIVGLYGVTGRYLQSALKQNVYIPSSAIPETFTHVADESHLLLDDVPADPGGFGYVLASPGTADEFLAEAEAVLEMFGFRPVLFDNGWEEYQRATVGLRQRFRYCWLDWQELLVAGPLGGSMRN